MRIVHGLVFASALLLHASMAHADPTLVDRVELDDGTEARGTITQIVPDDHVSVRDANGRTTLIAWSRIRRIERGLPAPEETPAAPAPTPPAPAPAPAPAPPPVPAPAPPPAPAPAPDKNVVAAVRMHVDSDRKVSLQYRRAARYEWTTLCESPCDANVPLDGDYRIAGDGVRPSSTFTITASAGQRVRVHVAAGSSTAAGWGKGLLIGGGVLSVIGLAASDSSRGPIVATGVVAAAIGGVLLIANLQTYVQSSEGRTSPPSTDTASDRARAAAIWRVDPNAPHTPVFALPIVRGAF